MKRTRIIVTLEVDVDLDRWNAEYDSQDTITDVRYAVVDNVYTAATEAFRALDGAVRLRVKERRS